MTSFCLELPQEFGYGGRAPVQTSVRYVEDIRASEQLSQREKHAQPKVGFFLIIP